MKWFEKSLPILNPLLIFPSLSNASVINKFAFNETSSISQIELGRKRERERNFMNPGLYHQNPNSMRCF